MLAAVVGFALVCSAIYMRCDFLQFFVNHPTQHFTPCKSDFAYKNLCYSHVTLALQTPKYNGHPGNTDSS